MAAAYCASKFGAVGFSKCMADELRRFGIKVTSFTWGIDSPFWDNAVLKSIAVRCYLSETAANAIMFALSADPQAVPMEINIQPESHSFKKEAERCAASFLKSCLLQIAEKSFCLT